MRRRASSPRTPASFAPSRNQGQAIQPHRPSRRNVRQPVVGQDAPLEPNSLNTNSNHLNGVGRNASILRSFFAGGFECSTHVRRSGVRLDLINATAHDKFALQDYLRLGQQGIRVAREGIRWHLVETEPGNYDFTSLLPITEAARSTHTQVIWDLCHFGWPSHLDLFGPEFAATLARYGAAVAQWLAEQLGEPPFIVPVNEISFFAWAAGDEGSMFPFVRERGFELKTHLVRATIETMKAIWAAVPCARFVQVDPIIHVVASTKHPEEIPAAEAYRLSQYQAWDMLSGRLCPELGGEPRFIDIVGVNFYPHNQWVYNLKNFRPIRRFMPLTWRHPKYRPLREMLRDVYERYQRPVMIAETGAEDRRRARWLRYICEETREALRKGVPVEGMCLYPILNHPGWLDDRHCHNGLWDYPDEAGNRNMYKPLGRELARWRDVFERWRSPGTCSHVHHAVSKQTMS